MPFILKRQWIQKNIVRFDVPMERPRAFRQTAELIYGFPIKYHKMAADVRMHEPFVRQIVEIHAGRAKGAASGKITELPPTPTKSASVVSFPVRHKKD